MKRWSAIAVGALIAMTAASEATEKAGLIKIEGAVGPATAAYDLAGADPADPDRSIRPIQEERW